MEKPFKTHNQQMKYLRDSKGIDCCGSEHKHILIQNGYFNLINGYKTPFVIGEDSNGNHRYIGGTNLKHLQAVKDFDEELRYILLRQITRCEEEIRTLTGHKFDYENRKGKIKWFSVEAYNPNISAQDKIKVIAKCYNEIDRSQQPYVKHYLDEYSSIPTWIFVKVINFSTFIDFLKMCKPSVINSICNLYSIEDLQGNDNPDLLVSALHWMRKIRNACAHNERIYDICRANGRVNYPFHQFLQQPNNYLRHRSQRVIDLLVYLRYFLSDKDYCSFLGSIKASFLKLKEQLNPNAFEKVRAETGIRDLIVLDQLASTHKIIDYNRFEQL